jgi:ParB family transcriptional regulator, chromosome partitioning protein
MSTITFAEVTSRLAASDRLRQRRFETLPPDGPGAPWCEAQGRGPGESTSAAGLVELMSSIGTVGVLQPILVEELADGFRRVVAGSRRLMAVRAGRLEDATNPHFLVIPALICPGPLSAAEIRCWQLIENLARTDLADGELGAALMWERCELLTMRLAQAGHPVDVSVLSEDPRERWPGLERSRLAAGLHGIGAPWGDVLGRLGLQLTTSKAEKVVRAFASLPPDMSTDMDAHQVAVSTRLEWIRFAANGRTEAAAAIWAALKERGRPGLLRGALSVAEDLAVDVGGVFDAGGVVDQAEVADEEARAARTATRLGLRAVPDLDDGGERVMDAAGRFLIAAETLSEFEGLLGRMVDQVRAGAVVAGPTTHLHDRLVELAAMLAELESAESNGTAGVDARGAA